MGKSVIEKQEYGDGCSGRYAGWVTEAMGMVKKRRRWTRFSSTSALGSIVTQSTLLLLNILLDFNNDSDKAQHPPRCFRLGRGKDWNFKDYARGGSRQCQWHWRRGYPRPSSLVWVYVNAVIWFCIPAWTKEEAYSIGRGAPWRWRRKGGVGTNSEEV